MKILKSDTLSLSYRALRFAKRDSLVIGMLACFRFGSAPHEALLDDKDMWPLITQALGKDGLLDEGYPKPAGEYKVYGAAHATDNRPVTQQRVAVRFGSLSKSLIVTGDRHFNALGLISAPQPYIRLPIVPDTAFGGTDHADNPHGKGYADVQQADGTQARPLPNVEYESRRIANRGDRTEPAGFWAFDIAASLRKQHLGTCDDAWLKQGWPCLPDDTNPELFMSAAPDQRLASGYFTGNEAFSIENMHPSVRVQQGTLPSLRARCFINRKTVSGDVFIEVPAHAETVWLFPEQSCGVVLYRALAACADDEASDIRHIKAAWEYQSDAPLSLDHYRAEFLAETGAAYETESVALVEAFAVPAVEEPAAPAVDLTAEAEAVVKPASDKAAAQLNAQLEAELSELHALTDRLNAETRALMHKHNLNDADLAKFMSKPEPVAPLSTLAEVEKLAEQINAETRAFMQKYKLTDADLARFMPKPPPEGTMPFAEVGKAVEELNTQMRALMQKHNLSEADLIRALPPDVAARFGSASLFDTPVVDFASLDARLAAMLQPKSSPVEVPEIEVLPLPGIDDAPAQLTREDVMARHAEKASLAGYDLTGLDLSGLDLAGADFSASTLDKVSFAKSRLDAAVFEQALLREADFSEASLQQARLVGVSAGGGQFTKANLQHARLDQGDFTGCDFSEASLAQARLTRAVFDQSKLSGIDASACEAEQTSFTGCDLSGADFGGAMLSGAQFNESQLAKSRFSGALCQHAEFYGAVAPQSDFTRADLRHSRADDKSCFEETNFTQTQLGRACWDGAQLHKASFEGAQLAYADFSNVKANAARFGLVSAKGARFDRADLSGAEMSAINLFGGSLRKANLSGTRMVGANLYGVDFIDTQPTLASVEGANIDHTILQFRPAVL